MSENAFTEQSNESAQNMFLHITYFINTNPVLFKGLKGKICLSMENLHFNIKVS